MSNPLHSACKADALPVELQPHNSHSLVFYEEKGGITSIGASPGSRTLTILLTRQAQYRCAREAYKLVRMDRTSSWYLTRASNPEKVRFELTMSASCISQVCGTPTATRTLNPQFRGLLHFPFVLPELVPEVGVEPTKDLDS